MYNLLGVIQRTSHDHWQLACSPADQTAYPTQLNFQTTVTRHVFISQNGCDRVTSKLQATALCHDIYSCIRASAYNYTARAVSYGFRMKPCIN